MRTRNSLKNMIAAVATNIITIILGFIAQAIFLKILGTEYLGVNGLFTNVVSMLGIVELGIGSAIIFHLYQPIAENDKKKIKALMSFYKKAYHIIAIIILILGIGLIPLLGTFITDVKIDINITFVYILFILDIIASYLLAYKRSVLYADQKNYLVNIIHIFYLICLNSLQLITLYLTKNYYYYLMIKIIMRIVENIIITTIVNRKYIYLKEKNKEKLDEKTQKDIYKKVRALFFHKIGSFIVLGTDNIIISKYLGIISVGLYSNYQMIISAIHTLFSQMISAITPSVGNLLVEKDSQKNYEVFKKIRFLNFVIATFASSALLIVMDSFVTIWIGKKYILPLSVLIVLVINLYQSLMRTSFAVFKEAAGIFYEDRFVPLIESGINMIASIILVKFFGLAGVFMGTIISSLTLWCYSYPKYVYKNLFKKDYKNYGKEMFGYLLLFLIITFISYFLSNLIQMKNPYIYFIYKVATACLIPNILMLLVFIKSENLTYFVTYLKRKEKTYVKKSK